MTATHPEIAELCEAIVADNPKHRPFLDAAIERLNEEESAGLADYMNFCLDDGMDIADLAKGYGVILQDTLNEQLHFLRHVLPLQQLLRKSRTRSISTTPICGTTCTAWR